MKSLVQGHPDGKWQSQGLNPDLPDSRVHTFTPAAAEAQEMSEGSWR